MKSDKDIVVRNAMRIIKKPKDGNHNWVFIALIKNNDHSSREKCKIYVK